MEKFINSCIKCSKTCFTCMCRPILTRNKLSYHDYLQIKTLIFEFANQNNNSQTTTKSFEIQQK